MPSKYIVNNNRPIPIIGKTADYRPFIGASLVFINLSTCM